MDVREVGDLIGFRPQGKKWPMSTTKPQSEKPKLNSCCSMVFPARAATENSCLRTSFSKTMKTIPLLLAIMTATMVGVTFLAWRNDNQRRDVVLLAVFAGLFAVGLAVAVVS